MKTRKDEQRLLCQVCRTETTHDVTHTNDRSGRTTFERECPLCGHRETTTYYRSDGRWWIVENGPEYPILEDIDEAEGFVDNMKRETITPKRLAQRVIDIAQRVIDEGTLETAIMVVDRCNDQYGTDYDPEEIMELVEEMQQGKGEPRRLL